MKAKKSILVFSFFICFIKFQAQQRFVAGLKAGISTSQVEGDTYAGFHKTGIDGGAFVRGKISDKISLQMEILYIEKGSKYNANPDNGDNVSYALQLNYIEIPLLLQFQYKKFIFGLGPSYSYLLKQYEVYNDYQNLTGDHPFNQNEVSLDIGISCKLYKKFSVDWRYTNSITSIRDFQTGTNMKNNWFYKGERNNVLAFTLTYQFGKNESKE